MNIDDRDTVIRDLTEHHPNPTRQDVRDWLGEHLYDDDWDEHDVDNIHTEIQKGGQP